MAEYTLAKASILGERSWRVLNPSKQCIAVCWTWRSARKICDSLNIVRDRGQTLD